MPSILGELIVILVLVGVCALAIRSMWKDHKAGRSIGGCDGNCSHCHGGCAHSAQSAPRRNK